MPGSTGSGCGFKSTLQSMTVHAVSSAGESAATGAGRIANAVSGSVGGWSIATKITILVVTICAAATTTSMSAVIVLKHRSGSVNGRSGQGFRNLLIPEI
jgi:hypothetical protein